VDAALNISSWEEGKGNETFTKKGEEEEEMIRGVEGEGTASTISACVREEKKADDH